MYTLIKLLDITVTPFVGVWIEIMYDTLLPYGKPVTPFVGVWIEIVGAALTKQEIESLPSWECGLK